MAMVGGRDGGGGLEVGVGGMVEEGEGEREGKRMEESSAGCLRGVWC